VGRILLTGGTGYLGGILADRLLRAGETLTVLVRRPGSEAGLPRGIRAACGDVTDLDSLRRAAEGCDRIVHAAAHVRMWDPDPGRFARVNLGGLENVLRAGREAGVARILYTSSFLALGPTDGSTGDEDWDVAGRVYHNAYERTKTEADRIARREAESGAPLVILYPGVVYGPGRGTSGNLIGGMIRDFLARRIPGIPGRGDRRFCYAFSADVAEGYVAALERASPGERFILGGENRTLVELFGELERLTGVPAPRRRIPYPVAALAGKLQRWRARWTGRQPEITDEVIGIYQHEWAYTSRRAQERLGYRITPFAVGLRIAVAEVAGERE
jgi:farnesol dehydrogenase